MKEVHTLHVNRPMSKEIWNVEYATQTMLFRVKLFHQQKQNQKNPDCLIF